LHKLNSKCLGPFKVLDKVGNLDYKLELPFTIDLHNIFYVDQLTRAMINETYKKLPQPNPIEISSNLKFEVEKILDSNHNWCYSNRILYLVRAMDWAVTHEKASRTSNMQRRLLQFYKKHPEAPRKLSASVFLSLPWQRIESLTEASTQYTWKDGIVADEAISNFRRVVMLRYVMQKPNPRVRGLHRTEQHKKYSFCFPLS
jgi:hypothetical protein